MIRNLALILMLAASNPSMACLCSGGGLLSIVSAFENADYVFIGEVIESESNNSFGVVQIKFKVLKNYHGAQDSQITVYAINGGGHYNSQGDTMISSCGSTFITGGSYVVFSSNTVKQEKFLPLGSPFISGCSLTEAVTYPISSGTQNALLYYLNSKEKGLELELVSKEKLRGLFNQEDIKVSDFFVIKE